MLAPLPTLRPPRAEPIMPPEEPGIAQAGAEVLRARARELPTENIGTPEFRALVSRMVEAMR